MEEPTLTVAELSAGVTRAVAKAFPDEVWVRGEIRNLNRAASGHVYFALVDPQSGSPGEATTLLPVTLFATEREAVNRALVRSGALRMTDGVEVRIRGRVAHYPARGSVQLRMSWIDTDYTIGRLAADREHLLRRLEAEGLLGRNATLPVPAVALRVGLLTSRGSAAEADFLEILRASGFGFGVIAADTRVQGIDAPPALRSGLAALGAVAPDVIAIVRGGGAATDLAAFDDESLARAIASAPVPVLTGIGHEIDTTVADRVAAASFATPTACAAALVDRVAGFVRSIDLVANRVTAAVENELKRNRGVLDEASRHLAAAATASVRVERSLAGARRRRLVDEVFRALDRARRQIATTGARVDARDPMRLLAQGWSITRDANGAIVRSVDDVEDGAELSTRVGRGRIASVVTGTEEDGG